MPERSLLSIASLGEKKKKTHIYRTKDNYLIKNVYL